MKAFLELSPLVQWLVSFFLLFGFYLWWLQRRPPQFPPGPFRLPLVGNLLTFSTDPTKTLTTDAFRQYNGIYSMALGVVPAVILDSPAVMLAAYKKGGLKTAGRATFSEYLNAACKDGRDILLSQPDERWAAVRKFIHASLFKPSVLEALDISGRVLKNYHRTFKLIDQQKEKPIEPLELIRFTVYSTMLELLYSRDFESPSNPEYCEQDRCWSLIFHTCAVGNPTDFLPPWMVKIMQIGRNKAEEPYYKALKCVSDWTLKQISDHEEVLAKEKIRLEASGSSMADYQAKDLCDQFLLHRYTAAPEVFNGSPAERWLDNESLDLFLRDFIAGGSDTTAASVTWAILLAANYQDKQKLVQAELDSVLKDRKIPTAADELDCPYSRAFLKECQRYRTVAPAMAHKTTKPIEVADLKGHQYIIPADVILMSIMPSILHDKEVWGDADNFRPERFLCLEPKKESEIYFPFGLGPRSCPGMNLATVSTWLGVAALLKRYEILPGVGNSVSEDYLYGLSITPKPFKLRFKLRQ